MNVTVKKSPKEKREFLAKVATLYYVNGLSQKEIAEQLDVGRTSVVRLLNEARELGIVTISISTPTDEYRIKNLERMIMQKYKLKDCLVVNGSGQEILDHVVPKYLDTVLPYSGAIAVGGGHTTYELGKKMWLCQRRPKLEIVQITGSVSNLPETNIIKQWSEALGAEGIYITAPLLAKDKESKELLLEDPTIMMAMEALGRAETCVVGIGANDAQVGMDYLKYYPDIDSEYIVKNTVGNIAFHYYDSKTKFIMKEISERLIGIKIADYKQIKTKIAVAYGENKVTAIQAALNGGLVDVLITDFDTARMIVE